jgi:hypothetical protein
MIVQSRRGVLALRPLLVPLAVAVLLTGCGGGAELGEPTPSGVEGLPVPSAAVMQSESGPSGVSTGSETWAVPGADGEELLAWYDERLAQGEDWRGWQWCELNERGDSVQRYWVRDGQDMSVIVFPGEEPPQVLISAGEATAPC